MIFMILVSLENVLKNVFWVVARTRQRLKSMFFKIKISPPLRPHFIRKTLILAFEANSALSRENETKIGKITHSVERVSELKSQLG